MRDKDILSIRPELPSLDNAKSLPKEVFQNETIRPILKLQHSITSALLDSNSHFEKLYPNPSLLTTDQYNEAVKNFLKSNKEIRTKILGVIIGMMTLEEYKLYLLNKSEYNKRIISMQAKRYADSRAAEL